MKQHAIDEFGTDGVTPALQRSESQDSWCSVSSTGSHYSETSSLEGDRLVATSVSARLLTSAEQPLRSQWDWLNSDLETRYQNS